MPIFIYLLMSKVLKIGRNSMGMSKEEVLSPITIHKLIFPFCLSYTLYQKQKRTIIMARKREKKNVENLEEEEECEE